MCLRRGISCYGGVLCSHISMVTINYCLFDYCNNSAYSSRDASHGGVLASFHSQISISHSILKGNSANGSAGVILLTFLP